MRISAKGRYGLQAMLDLALAQGELVTLSRVAERQAISLNYLEQVFAALRNAGLVRSVKGAQGGYTLARHPQSITVGQIIRAIEGELWPLGAVAQAGESDVGTLPLLQNLVFVPMQSCVNSLLDGLHLECLADEYVKRKASTGIMYHI